jgi:hypothetical protein
LERALQELSKLEALRAAQTGGRKARGEARASTTDPEARRIKMGDGGFRPAYNVQFAADTESRFIVGVGITNIGSDQAEAIPMIDQVEERTGKRPDEYLVDGGFTGKDNVNDIRTRQCRHQGSPQPGTVPCTGNEQGIERSAAQRDHLQYGPLVECGEEHPMRRRPRDTHQREELASVPGFWSSKNVPNDANACRTLDSACLVIS